MSRSSSATLDPVENDPTSIDLTGGHVAYAATPRRHAGAPVLLTVAEVGRLVADLARASRAADAFGCGGLVVGDGLVAEALTCLGEALAASSDGMVVVPFATAAAARLALETCLRDLATQRVGGQWAMHIDESPEEFAVLAGAADPRVGSFDVLEGALQRSW